MSITQAIVTANEYALIKERDDALARIAELENREVESGVTVCIPTHNDGDVLPRAVDSALTQTVAPLEVIVVDDGSDVPPVCPGATVVSITNRGLPAARNVALMLARGDAFLPLDADDWLDPTYLEKTLPLLAEAEVVFTGLQEHGPTRNGTYMAGFDRPFNLVDEQVLWEYNRFYYASLFRTQYLRSVGGYNTFMAGGYGVSGGYEDWDLWIDMMRRGARFAAVNEPLFHYTTKPESMLTRAEANRAVLVGEMKRHHRVC